MWIKCFQPFGLDFFCLGKKFLVFNLVSRNLKIKYRRSVFGFLWTLLSPIAMACIYYFVFKVVLNVKIPHYLVFILSGILPWNFFGQSISEGMESIVGSWGLLSKVPIPIQIFPYVGTLTNFITLLLALPVLLSAAILSGVEIGTSIFLFPFYLLSLFLLVYSFSLILAYAFVFLRDLRHVMSIILQIWFYATPVVYDPGMIPEKYRFVLYANPLGCLFSGIQHVLAKGEWPPSVDVGVTAFWVIASIGTALLFQKYLSKGLIEQI